MFTQFTSILFYLLMFANIVLGHPIREHEGNKVGSKIEKKFPNGTVVGKYSYKDKDGNPIHVKYFADDSSYGVELKSVRVFGSHPEYMRDKLRFDMMTPDALEPFDSINTANSMLNKEFHKNKSYNQYEVLNVFPKESRYKGIKKENNDYEIFLENDLKPSEKCGKEKVRVYSDKIKRKTRESNNNNKFFCERY